MGIILTGLFGAFSMLSLKAKLYRSNKKQEALQREIDALRNQPLYEGGRDQPNPSTESTILDQES